MAAIRGAHGMFLRAKLSEAFRLLEDPPSSDIIQEDWELAGMLMRYSRRCYEENLQEYRNGNLKRRADYKEEDELVREQVDMRSQLATEERIMEVLSNSPKPSVSKGELTRSLSKRQKASLDAALENPDGFRKDQTQEGHEGRPLVFACVSDLPTYPPTHYCRKGFCDLPTYLRESKVGR